MLIYRYQTARLDSFKNWTASYIKPEKLAAVGFYFTGRNESIKCFECHLEISKWPSGLGVVANHKIFSPKCKIARQFSCNNVSTNLDDKRDKYVYDMEHNEFMLHIKIAKHPEYRFYQARFDSFASWPPAKHQTREQLAEAGFYYTGHLDEVSCFYCGVSLMDWDDNEESWEMHYRRSSTCFYILTIKGENYLQNLQKDIYEKQKNLVIYNTIPAIKLACCEMKTQGSQSSQINIKNVRDSISTLPIKNDVTNNILTPSIKNKYIKNKDFDKLYDTKAESSKSHDESDDESKLICTICYAKERNILFLPCGHIISCINCSKRLNNVCPYCRKEIKSTIRVRYK